MEELKSKKPSIRFPEFKEGWNHVQLSELLKEAKKRNEDLKYSKDEVLSVSGEFGIVNQIEHLGRSYAGASVHNYHVVEKGDIVYTKSPLKENPYGIIKLNRGNPGIVSTLYAVYQVKKENAVGEFLDYYFALDANTNRYLRPLVKKGAKNDMKINNAYVLHDRIYAPSIREQKRIASFFQSLDERISLLKLKHSFLTQYKKGLIQNIFTKELRFFKSNGSNFPTWEKIKFGQVYSFHTNNSLSKDKLNFESGKVRNLHYGDVHTRYKTQFHLKTEIVPFINAEVNITNIQKENYCKKGDLIIADASEDYSDIGKAIEIADTNGEAILSGLHTILARPDLDKISYGFGGYMMIGNRKAFISEFIEKQFVCGSVHGFLKVQQPIQKDSYFEVKLEWNEELTFAEMIVGVGLTPLPPYLKRAAVKEDEQRYQTVYAQKEGSVAAPTAGLHFTEEVLHKLAEAGYVKTEVVLHVGAGTFRPVKSATMKEHDMHSEEISVSVEALKQLERNAHNLIAVGTTSLRTLESLFWLGWKLKLSGGNTEMFVGQWEPYDLPSPTDFSFSDAMKELRRYLESKSASVLNAKTALLIAPGYTIRSVRGLITNFHQPNSTLLLLVAALIGDAWKKVYDHALNNQYRFLSFGDSSLLMRSDQ